MHLKNSDLAAPWIRRDLRAWLVEVSAASNEEALDPDPSRGVWPGLSGSAELAVGLVWARFACACRCVRRFRPVVVL
ncbi:hypothetical protein, partial [Myceligenerans indicum]|uniref:hypothetical protein n=1 Tax=Myceligenerans indicum TaxID=2593663 RepID=UPI001A929AC4